MILFEVHFKNFPEPRPYVRHGIDLRRTYIHLAELDIAPTGLWIDVEIPEVNRRTGQQLRGRAKLAVPLDDIEYILAFDDGTAPPESPHRQIGFIHPEEDHGPARPELGPVAPVE